jgi:hypothetical protein
MRKGGELRGLMSKSAEGHSRSSDLFLIARRDRPMLATLPVNYTRSEGFSPVLRRGMDISQAGGGYCQSGLQPILIDYATPHAARARGYAAKGSSADRPAVSPGWAASGASDASRVKATRRPPTITVKCLGSSALLILLAKSGTSPMKGGMRVYTKCVSRLVLLRK